ncbi:MAG: electron transfer flavoprotein subunit beta/FixA family protein [Alphaproteobacteria bacterium]|nr:electron transfer flavoprotein subunit beta/FixA family protein [Alphaproteobacteria bacterium]
MKILVSVKRVIDATVKIRLRADGAGVETAGVKFSINPFDEIALEEAVRLKERGIASEVLAVSMGAAACQETLRHALALGADRAVLVESDAILEPLTVAKLLAALTRRESPGLVLMGKQAIDGDENQCGQMLAGLLDWPQASFASKLELKDGRALVARETEQGIERLDLPLPAVVTADLRLNTPRFATLPKIMQARKKPIERLDPAALGVDPTPRLEVLKLEAPPARRAGRMVDSVAALVEALRTEARVL